MFTNMFIGSPAGNYDRIRDFSAAKTGSLFFVPTLDMLDAFLHDDLMLKPLISLLYLFLGFRH